MAPPAADDNSPQVRLQQTLESLENELHTARSSKQDVVDELGALKSTMASQEQLVKVSAEHRIRRITHSSATSCAEKASTGSAICRANCKGLTASG